MNQKFLVAVSLILAGYSLTSCQRAAGTDPRIKPPSTLSSSDSLQKTARQLAHEFILVDTHVDLPYRLSQQMEDISEETGGDFDYPRARDGGLNAPFMSIYVPTRYQEGGARQIADQHIDLVEGLVSRWPDKFAPARSPAEVRQNFALGRISLPLGMENGAPIEGDLHNLEHFYKRGIRYITLAHAKSNHLCDSSYDPERRWNGLSPFGRKVVAEMNRLGIMIDVSHVSDETFFQIMALTRAPVIASHSSCRHFTPGWERNMSDAMLLELRDNGGVIQINFGSNFLSKTYRDGRQARERQIEEYFRLQGLQRSSPKGRQYIEEYDRLNPVKYADVSDVAAHIDYVVRLIGINHVGLGSDFDGVGDSLPVGLKDVSDYPNIIHELLKRNYTRKQIEKICSGNLLRVWSEVEHISRRLQAK